MIRAATIFALVVGCSTAPRAARDAASEDAGSADSAPLRADAMPMSIDTGLDTGDVGADDTAPVDAFIPPDTGATLSAADACSRLTSFWATTPCDPDLFWCGYIGDVSVTRLEACEDGVRRALVPLDGSACTRAINTLPDCYR